MRSFAFRSIQDQRAKAGAGEKWRKGGEWPVACPPSLRPRYTVPQRVGGPNAAALKLKRRTEGCDLPPPSPSSRARFRVLFGLLPSLVGGWKGCWLFGGCGVLFFFWFASIFGIIIQKRKKKKEQEMFRRLHSRQCVPPSACPSATHPSGAVE